MSLEKLSTGEAYFKRAADIPMPVQYDWSNLTKSKPKLTELVVVFHINRPKSKPFESAFWSSLIQGCSENSNLNISVKDLPMPELEKKQLNGAIKAKTFMVKSLRIL